MPRLWCMWKGKRNRFQRLSIDILYNIGIETIEKEYHRSPWKESLNTRECNSKTNWGFFAREDRTDMIYERYHD